MAVCPYSDCLSNKKEEPGAHATGLGDRSGEASRAGPALCDALCVKLQGSKTRPGDGVRNGSRPRWEDWKATHTQGTSGAMAEFCVSAGVAGASVSECTRQNSPNCIVKHRRDLLCAS